MTEGAQPDVRGCAPTTDVAPRRSPANARKRTHVAGMRAATGAHTPFLTSMTGIIAIIILCVVSLVLVFVVLFSSSGNRTLGGWRGRTKSRKGACSRNLCCTPSQDNVGRSAEPQAATITTL